MWPRETKYSSEYTDCEFEIANLRRRRGAAAVAASVGGTDAGAAHALMP